MQKEIGVGLLGFGTVGSGTARILLEKKGLISKRTGRSIKLCAICDKDITSERGFPMPADILTTDLDRLLDDPSIQIFVELIGGLEPAKTFILKAIEKGKHVVTANKALLAVHGHEIFKAATAKGVLVGFEASVGGGIPVIKAVREGLVANRLHTILGIMNGTSNYILSRMTDEDMAFTEVLKQAKKLGFAEADPAYDIEGIDTAHKLAILSTLAFGSEVRLSDIYIEGISSISPIDIHFATEFGYTIKLLAISRETPKGLELRVHPTMIPTGHLLSQVKGAYNAFYLVGDSVGKILLYGLGAGQMPTGSAVVSDIVDIAQIILGQAQNDLVQDESSLFNPVSKIFENLAPLQKCPMEELKGRYYFRFSAVDSPGVLASIAGILGEHGISIYSVIQKGRGREKSVPIVMLTHEAREADIIKAVDKIDKLDIVTDKTVLFRIMDIESIEKSF